MAGGRSGSAALSPAGLRRAAPGPPRPAGRRVRKHMHARTLGSQACHESEPRHRADLHANLEIRSLSEQSRWRPGGRRTAAHWQDNLKFETRAYLSSVTVTVTFLHESLTGLSRWCQISDFDSESPG